MTKFGQQLAGPTVAAAVSAFVAISARCIAAPTVMALSVALLAGCAVGPDFKTPAAPAAQGYGLGTNTATVATPDTAGGDAQRFVEGRDLPERWWTAFASPALDQLIDEALRASPDLQSAESALRGAQENVLAQRGSYWPTVNAGFTSNRQLVADPLASPAVTDIRILNLHTAQVSVGFVPDVFGANRRQVESLQAQAEAVRFQREATYVTLTTNIVVAAIQEASLRAQIAATREIIDVASRQLVLVRRQQVLGQLAPADVAPQETLLAQARAGLPPLNKQLAQQRDLLALLTGRLPSEAIATTFELGSLKLPEELPLTLPSRLVEQRPDVRAAQAQWHAASANIGVAKAARLPSITLSANTGSAAYLISDLFQTGTGFWSLGANLAQPIFDGGTLKHRQRAAEAAAEQAAAQYRSTLLTAFQNVADTLHAIQFDAQTLAATSEAERAARKSLAFARRQRELGAVGVPAELNAQQAYAQTTLALVQAQAARLADTAALYQALGGGWWNRAHTDPGR